MKKKNLNKTQLWKLRKEIVLNSLYTSDYANSFGFTPNTVASFFEGYCSYLWEQVTEFHGHNSAESMLDEYDNADNLWAWYLMYDEFPFEYDN
jgi:hypothetical protein